MSGVLVPGGPVTIPAGSVVLGPAGCPVPRGRSAAALHALLAGDLTPSGS